jgi:ABC-type multidrug transport system ATPase subunit
MRPTAGQVRIHGEHVTRENHAARRKVGFLSHQSLLYDDLTLLENLTFAARLYLLDHPEQVARTALEAAGLGERAAELPGRLSRGLLQRAAIARATLHDPEILLLDEPFTGLDAGAADQLRTRLETRLARGHGVVLVTHDLTDAWNLATRVAVLIEGRWAAEEMRQGSLESFLPRYHGLIGA